MIDILTKIQAYAEENPVSISWRSVSHPFNLWPSLQDVEKWDTQPDLKLKRFTMWHTFAEQLSVLGVKSLVDVGTASGQFVLCCLQAGIEQVYGIDPQHYYLYSNESDFTESAYNAKDHLFLGDVEAFMEIIKSTKDFQIDCISILNFFHGGDWYGRDLKLLETINGKTKYLVTSDPINPNTLKYLYDNYDPIYHYKQTARYEDHFIFKSKHTTNG